MWIIGAITLARGVSYLPPLVNPDRSAAHFLEVVLPPTAWAWVWLASGALALVASARHQLIPVALGATVGLHALWALSFIESTVAGYTPRGWVSAISYAGIVLLAMWAFGRAGTAGGDSASDGR